MYPDSFDYYPAKSLADAQQLMAAHPGAKLLAGGQSLIPIMKLRLASLEAVIVGSSRVDLQACKLEYSIVSPK